MTIAAAYLTSEGVVLGADSTTTVAAGPFGVAQLLDHAQKVYEIGDHTSFALCTWGAGQVGRHSHRTIAALIGDQLTPASTTKDVVDILLRTVSPEIHTLPPGSILGYFVAGADPSTRQPRCFCVVFNEAAPQPQGSPTGTAGPTVSELQPGQAMFQGAPNYFTRVFRGYDPQLPAALFAALKRRLPQVQDLDAAFNDACNEALPPFASVGCTDLPIREAIDFVHTYLAVTIKAFKFRYGPPACGGQIEIGFVTTDRRFRWAAHKSFLSAVCENQVHS